MTVRRSRILIVDDEKDICEFLFRILHKDGYAPIVAHDGEAALEMIRLGMPDLVISDVRMSKMDGIELLRQAKECDPNLPVIIVTGFPGIDGAIQAMRLGAFDYLLKPIDTSDLMNKIQSALQNRAERIEETIFDPSSKAAVEHLRELMGPSEAVQRVVSDVATVAPSDFSVVIQGETGTGKELIAGTLHKVSPRCKGPFVPVDCGAIPESLFESELFGHEKGAFTGAVSANPGKFELAHGGTLFLDEIANMPKYLQPKLLRAIQERTFFRVGGRKAVTVDLRLVVASNRDLNEAVQHGLFSRDLFYRLSEFTIVIPPIRERRDDIIHLADRFLKATNMELAKRVKGFSKSATEGMIRYDWPGNVRQIKSVVRRAVLIADEFIRLEHLSLPNQASEPQESEPSSEYFEWKGLSLKEAVRQATATVERKCLLEALRKTGGNKAKAARLLAIDRKTLHSKLKEYSITLEDEEDQG